MQEVLPSAQGREVPDVTSISRERARILPAGASATGEWLRASRRCWTAPAR